MPIAHGEGNFYLPDDELDRLEGEGRVVFRYTTADGRLEDAANVNGSARAIAGVCNEAGNVVGLMPHPERAAEPELGSADGRRVFEALVRSCAGGGAVPGAEHAAPRPRGSATARLRPLFRSADHPGAPGAIAGDEVREVFLDVGGRAVADLDRELGHPRAVGIEVPGPGRVEAADTREQRRRWETACCGRGSSRWPGGSSRDPSRGAKRLLADGHQELAVRP